MNRPAQPPRRWSRLSHEPTLLATSERSGWRGLEFQEIAAPETGTFDMQNTWHSTALNIFQTCGPIKVRYGNSRNPFSDLLPEPKWELPGNVEQGAWVGAQRSLHLFVDVEAFERLTHRPFRRNDFISPDGPNPSITHLLHALHIDVARGHHDGPLLGETIVAAILHQLLATERRRSNPASGGRLSRGEIARVHEWIDANLALPLSVESLAAEIDLSVRQLCRLFQATMGRSPYRYVLERRVGRAQELIRESRLTLTEIAAAVGFANQSHMAATFRRVLDASPSQFGNSSK